MTEQERKAARRDKVLRRAGGWKKGNRQNRDEVIKFNKAKTEGMIEALRVLFDERRDSGDIDLYEAILDEIEFGVDALAREALAAVDDYEADPDVIY